MQKKSLCRTYANLFCCVPFNPIPSRRQPALRPSPGRRLGDPDSLMQQPSRSQSSASKPVVIRSRRLFGIATPCRPRRSARNTFSTPNLFAAALLISFVAWLSFPRAVHPKIHQHLPLSVAGAALQITATAKAFRCRFKGVSGS